MVELDLTIRNLLEDNIILQNSINFYIGDVKVVTLCDCSLEWNETAFKKYLGLRLIKKIFRG